MENSHKSGNPEESQNTQIMAFDIGKMSKSDAVSFLKRKFLDEGELGIQQLAMIKKYMEIFKNFFADEKIKEFCLEEIEDFGKDKPKFFGFEISTANRTTWDYSDCNHPGYVKILEIEKELKTLKKEYEGILQRLNEPVNLHIPHLPALYYETNDEMTEVLPAVKMKTYSPKFSEIKAPK